MCRGGEHQTPSPADSAVHDLGSEPRPGTEQSDTQATNWRGEADKKEKGRKEVQKMKFLYETQLKNFQQNASKVEASLVNQIYQVRSCVMQASWVCSAGCASQVNFPAELQLIQSHKTIYQISFS